MGLVQPLKNVVKTALKPVLQQMQNRDYRRRLAEVNRNLESAYVDPSIKYPSYKSFDDFVDLERLRALDGYIRDRLAKRDKDIEFWTGPFTPNQGDNQNPGSRVVELTRRNVEQLDYFQLDVPELWNESEAAEEFSEVMDFIRTLPFKTTGRMMIMYDFNGRPVTAHRDHHQTDLCSEFIWFRTNLVKPFYMMNNVTGERRYVEGHTAWFDTVNQFHGADAAEGLSISLRVDGKFTDEFRARIPVPQANNASTPSFWASQVGEA